MSLKPEDFSRSILDEAYRLRHYAIAHSQTHELDEKTAMWVIRREAWLVLRREANFALTARATPSRNELMGLPVRVTVDDEPDVPMIQLVMEPMMRVRETSKR